MIDFAMLAGGLVLLYFGAEWLVGGAARLAESFGIAPLIVGLTVVAYGTSSPELVVGIGAALRDQGEIALGNVVGSNVANIGLILAVAALITPPRIDPILARREVWVLLGTTALVPLSLLGGGVQWWDGAVLVSLAVVYTVWMVKTARDPAVMPESDVHVRVMAEAADQAAPGKMPRSRAALAGIALVGLALLVGGGHLLVEGAIGLARTFGMSERIIGLTIVAIGTSLPELATSVIAAMRGHSDIAVGNVLGSNIFNVLLILGAASVTRSIDADVSSIALDLVVLGAMTVAAAIVIRTRQQLSRVEGLVLLLGYISFLSALALT